MVGKDTLDYIMRVDQRRRDQVIKNANAEDIYRNTELYNQFKSINLYELISRKASVVLWGNGYRITTKNQKISDIFAVWNKNNNLLELFFKVEKELSARGCCGVVIDPNGVGDLIFNIALPYNTNQFSLQSTGDVILAYVWTIVRYDNNPLWMISTYSQKGITRTFRATSEDTASIGAVSVKMNDKYIFPQKVVMNLDFTPAHWFTNLPHQNLLGMPLSTAYPDWVALQNIQKHLDNVFENMWKEVNYNRTRVFGNFTQKEIMDIIKNTGGAADWTRKSLVSLEDDYIIQAPLGGIESGKKMEILQGDPKIDKYIQAINDLIDLAFLSCGYSGLKDSNSVKTTSEIQYNLGNETQITNLKKILRQKQWKDFFDKALMMEGISKEELDDYIFEIKDNQLKFDRDQLENQQLLEDAGLISKVEMAQNIFGINESEAKDYLSKVKQHQQEYGTIRDDHASFVNKFKETDDTNDNDITPTTDEN